MGSLTRFGAKESSGASVGASFWRGGDVIDDDDVTAALPLPPRRRRLTAWGRMDVRWIERMGMSWWTYVCLLEMKWMGVHLGYWTVFVKMLRRLFRMVVEQQLWFIA
mmetsp:Transcript_53341/g.64279  ORF Transcript_53341/g.64279 Transcript_53341/m.64279 type:complete len:107 (+) Transcript_53341:514-834(+)